MLPQVRVVGAFLMLGLSACGKEEPEEVVTDTVEENETLTDSQKIDD